MKRTPEDDLFVIRFAAELGIAHQKAKLKGVSDEGFAAEIGVERPQLRKYLAGAAMPSVRTVAMAKKNYGVSVHYGDTDIASGEARDRKRQPKPVQLTLPLSIKASGSDQVDLKIKSSSLSRVNLELTVRRVG